MLMRSTRYLIFLWSSFRDYLTKQISSSRCWCFLTSRLWFFNFLVCIILMDISKTKLCQVAIYKYKWCIDNFLLWFPFLLCLYMLDWDMIWILSIPPDNGSFLHAVWGWSCYALSIACKRNIPISVFIFHLIVLSLFCIDFINFHVYSSWNICCAFLLRKLQVSWA